MASVTYTIPDEKLTEFKLGFLKAHPVPCDDEGDPLFTDNDWIKEWGKRNFMSAYKRGKGLIMQESITPEIDDGVMS